MCEPYSTARPPASHAVRVIVSTGAPRASPSLGRRRRAGTHYLIGHPRHVAGGAQQLVEPACLEVVTAEWEHIHRHRVVHEREWFARREPEPFQPGHLCALRHAEGLRDVVGRRPDVEAADPCGRLLARLRQVVVQAGELHGPAHLRVHDLGADAALAHEHAALHQVLDRATHGGPGHPEPLGELHLVLQPTPAR
jgi:hypothetical protein